jgi:FkbM family methyltransferase
LQIYSFEPNKIVFENLKENLKLNAVKNNILLFDVALSQVSNKYVNLFVPSFTGSGGGSLLNLHPEEGLSHKYTVRQMRLDDIEEIVKVDLMKIDVEGNEWNVISGSQNLIRKNRPVVFIELLRKWMKPFGHHPSDVFDYFINMGYYCFEISDSGIQKINKIDANTIGTNFVFCPIESKNKLKILNDFVLKG